MNKKMSQTRNTTMDMPSYNPVTCDELSANIKGKDVDEWRPEYVTYESGTCDRPPAWRNQKYRVIEYNYVAPIDEARLQAVGQQQIGWKIQNMHLMAFRMLRNLLLTGKSVERRDKGKEHHLELITAIQIDVLYGKEGKEDTRRYQTSALVVASNRNSDNNRTERTIETVGIRCDDFFRMKHHHRVEFVQRESTSYRLLFLEMDFPWPSNATSKYPDILDFHSIFYYKRRSRPEKGKHPDGIKSLARSRKGLGIHPDERFYSGNVPCHLPLPSEVEYRAN
jgi:hypothetical protein